MTEGTFTVTLGSILVTTFELVLNHTILRTLLSLGPDLSAVYATPSRICWYFFKLGYAIRYTFVMMDGMFTLTLGSTLVV